jgi:hypothetical protein
MGKKLPHILILRNKARLYFFKYIKGYKIKELYSDNNFSLGSWKNYVKNYKKIIIFDSLLTTKVVEYIKKKNINCEVIVYFWNTINDNNNEILKSNDVDAFYTFDNEDANTYNLNFNSQFYTKEIQLKREKIKFDVCFLGRSKNRSNEILKVKTELEQKGLKLNFKIVDNEKDYIKYKKYLDIISKSKCILDVVNDNRKGLTLRCMESIFLRKKLITNNTDIVNYDFYKKENIFIIGVDNIENISDFIESPYANVDEEIINYYDFENWIRRF